MTSAFDVAGVLRQLVPQVGSVKLHKLLYYCQGWHLAFTGEPLFSERLEAWDKGPVVPDVWRAERSGTVPVPSFVDDNERSTILYVVNRYGALSARELIFLSHQENPWVSVYRSLAASRIPNESLQEYFEAERSREMGRIDEALSRYIPKQPLETMYEAPPRSFDFGTMASEIDELLSSIYG